MHESVRGDRCFERPGLVGSLGGKDDRVIDGIPHRAVWQHVAGIEHTSLEITDADERSSHHVNLSAVHQGTVLDSAERRRKLTEVGPCQCSRSKLGHDFRYIRDRLVPRR